MENEEILMMPVIREVNVDKDEEDAKDGFLSSDHHKVTPKSSHENGFCGILCFRPICLQRFNNMKVFLLVFMITQVCQGITYSYMNLTVSTMERRFQIPSKITGVLLGVNDMSHLLTVLIVAHFLSRSHRPRWMGITGIVLGISVIILATPELLAPDLPDYSTIGSNVTVSQAKNRRICQASNAGEDGKCDRNDEVSNVGPLLLFSLGQLIFGIATTVPITLGIPFLDDNVKTKNSPMYYALLIMSRIFGPMLGVFLGTVCLSYYTDLNQNPDIRQDDPRWFGAWYLGYVVIGIACCATAWLFFCFPASPNIIDGQQEISKQKHAQRAPKSKANISGLLTDLKRLVVNPTYMVLVLDRCFEMFVISGYISFAMKYTEYHFRETPARVGKFSGLANVISFCCGTFVGGILIKKFKLEPRHVALLTLICGAISTGGFFVLQNIHCEPRTMHGTIDQFGMLEVTSQCSRDCGCGQVKYSPVCHVESGMNYFSGCHAGCSGSVNINQTEFFVNCSCVANSFPTTTVKRGFCETGCDTFFVFIAIGAAAQFFASVPFAGSVMLSMRVVDADLKALSKGLQTFFTSFLAFIPGPIIMGFVIDSTCKVWEMSPCDEKGACNIYDTDKLRFRMHLYVGLIKTASCLLYFYIYWRLRSMSFDRPLDTEQKAEVMELDSKRNLEKPEQ